VGEPLKDRLADAALGIVIFVALVVLVWYGWLKEALSW
jgi:hypothetical protein